MISFYLQSLISKTGESYKQCKPVNEISQNFEQSQRSYHFIFDQFRPFTNYSVEVQAYTRCPGDVSNAVSARTDEAGMGFNFALFVSVKRKHLIIL